MKNFMKGIITFVFALMIMLPISVFAATEITQEDFDTAKGGTPTKGITYSEGDFEVYSLDEGEYKFASDINIEDGIIFVNEKNVTFDLNGKTLTGSNSDFGNIVIYGKSVSSITGNGTITNGFALEDEFIYGPALVVDSGAILNIENGTFNGAVYATGFSEEEEITYSYINIKNGTFKDSLMLENANAVIDDATFDVSNRDAIYVNSGASIEINGGTFKSVTNGLMAEPSRGYNHETDEEIIDSNAKSIVINGGTFTGTYESGISAFGADNLEINGGTFTGGFGGFAFENIGKIVVKGGTFKASGEDTVGGIFTIGENAELLTSILGEGCEFDPAIEAQVIDKWDNKLVVSQNEISVINTNENNYKFIEGANLEYDSSKDDVATFRINTEYRFFKDGGKVYVDDVLVENTNYTSESGSTIIKFTKEYMASLSSGEHTLKVVFNNDKEATTIFTVKNSSVGNPQTLDNVMTYASILFIGIIAVISTLYLIKKSEN